LLSIIRAVDQAPPKSFARVILSESVSSMRNKFLTFATKTSIVTETISSGFPNLVMWFRPALGSPLLGHCIATAFEDPELKLRKTGRAVDTLVCAVGMGHVQTW
jgi:hypothetical protein